MDVSIEKLCSQSEFESHWEEARRMSQYGKCDASICIAEYYVGDETKHEIEIHRTALISDLEEVRAGIIKIVETIKYSEPNGAK